MCLRLQVDRQVQAVGEPTGQQTDTGVDVPSDNGDRSRLLDERVERGGYQGPPGGQPRPRKVGVAGREVRRPLAQCGDRVLRHGRVGDPPVGEDPERIVGDAVRGNVVPPGHHGRVRCQQRQDHRLRVQAEASEHPHDHGLTRPEPATDGDLGVQSRVGGVDLAPDDDEQATRMGRRRRGRGALGHADVLLVHHDHKGQRQTEGERPG